LQRNEQLNAKENGEENLQGTGAGVQGGSEVLPEQGSGETAGSEGGTGGQGEVGSTPVQGAGAVSQGEGTGQGVVAPSERLKPTDLRDGVKPDTTELGADEAKAKAQGLFEYFKGTIKELINEAKKKGNVLVKKIIAPVSSRLIDELASKGVDVEGYNHVLDNSAIRHTFKQHGSEQELDRGQIPITDEDFERILDVVENYDDVNVETGKRGEDNIVYSKSYPDGTTIFVEEKRDKRKELAAVTMWKMKNTTLTDANRSATPISDLSGNRREVYNLHTTAKQSAETDGASLSGEQGGTTPSTRMNAPTQLSGGKGSEKSEREQGKVRENAAGVIIPVEELAKISEMAEAQKRSDALSAQPPLQLTEKEINEYARRLLDAWHGSAVFENGKIREVDGHGDFSGAVKQERKAFVVIGRPAGGKSSVFANSLSKENGARVIDSDTVKEWLDGFDGGFGAGYVQDMSAKIAERALDIAVQNGDNIVLPRIGGKSVMIMSAALRAMGYDVQLYFNDVVPTTSYMRSSSRFAKTGRYLSLDYLTSIKDKPNKTFIKFAKKSIGDYINECTEEEIQKLRGRLESMAGRQRGDLLRALYGWLDTARRGNVHGRVQADVERPNTDGTSPRIDLDAPMFSYAEWKSNDVAFGEKPKEIWNSESGKELPENTNENGSTSARTNKEGSGRVSSGEPDDSTPAVAKRVDDNIPQRRAVGRGDSGVQERSGNGREQEVRQSTGRQGGGVQQLGRSSWENREGHVTNPKNLRNNHAERGTDYAPKGVDARIEANIKAIELMQQLVESGEVATPEQMAVLRKFSGWGGLGKAFENYTAYTNEKPTPRYLRELLGEEAYQQAVMSRNSAYYTPASVIDSLWDIAGAMGFKGGKVLEGSAGIGNILGLMPTDMSVRSDIHAVEIDGTTGNILRLLYPDAKVDVQGFEATEVENGSVDLAITNVPFVTGLRVNDISGDKDLSKKFHDIHDFCIAKNVRKLKEGGIGVFISSSGTLDNSQKLREWIVGEGGADVVGAFRLNNETFGGTGATSDIIVVRKRVNGKKSSNAIDVLSTTGVRVADYHTGEMKKVKGEWVSVEKPLSMDYNRYFVEHPENMGGEMLFGFEKGDTFRPTSKALYPVRGKNQAEMLDEWTKGFEGKDWGESATVSQHTEQPKVYEDLGSDVKEGSMVVSNGKLCVAQRGKAVPLAVNENKVKGHTKVECFNAYKGIKDALADVLDYQTKNDDDAGLEPLLKKLNKAYDGFVKTYGHLHKNTAISFLKNDVDFSNILALETFSEKGDVKTGKRIQAFGKTDVFEHRVVEKDKTPEPKNVKDAIIADIYLHGRIDLPWVAATLSQHTGQPMTEEGIKDEIVNEGLGFENPVTKQMEVSYEYLSGNVREKLQQAIENNDDGRYDANIKALEKVVPMNIPAHLIDFSIGSSWIDPKLYGEYVKEKTDVDVTFTPVGGTWYMKAPSWVNEEKNRAMGVVSDLLHKTIMGTQLIEAAMQNKTITVSETRKRWDGSTETITDKEATQACASKIDEIRQDFKEWARAKMQSDPVMSEQMERVYNDMFNNYVPKAIPDEFVPEYFNGATHSIKLDPHQSKAAIRGMTQPLLLAHEVGSGKTITLVTTAMEMRRLGTAKKPMIVVQNATVGQFVEEAKRLYPNAKILTIEEADRTPEGRKNFYAKIKYNDWDMIVVPQSVLERIPDSEERQMKFVRDKIGEKMLVLEQMKDADPRGQSMIVRQAEKEIEKLEDELASLSSSIVEKRKERDEKKAAVTRQNAEVKAMEMLDRQTDDVENFDDMGIDALLVDEAHEYKHLGFATAMQRGVKGVDPSYSKKAQGVFLKTQAVLEKNNGRNVIFATGTPISNTAAEIWTFMRYLMPSDVMKDYGIYYFDDFVRNFGNLTQMLEFTISGKFKENNRFAGYVNLPELARIWSGVADIVLNKDVEELRKFKGEESKSPDMEGGQAQDIYLPQTKALRSVMKYVKNRLDDYDKMSGKEKKENSHIPLTMYGIAKAAAVDARLVVDDAADEPQSKTNEAVRQTLRSLEDTKSYKGTVALFADNYQNKHSGFNLYEDIRKKLIEAGVPAEQIVIIKSGMSVKKKLEIFDAVNRGDIRVIMGSTFTLGTGVNIQERLHTLIHLDAPNRPMDYTQRNGRILRQGNIHKQMNKPVRVLRFGVKDSLDVTAYQRLKTKGAIADSIMNGKKMMENSMENRALEEEEDVFGDTVAQLSGSEYAMLKNQAEKDVRKYEAKKKQFEADQTYCHHEIPRLEGMMKEVENRQERDKKNLAVVEGKPQPAGITVGKQRFGSVEQMGDFLKGWNKRVKDAENALRDNPSIESQERKLTVNVGGIDFEFSTELSVMTKREQGTLFSAVHRRMTYSCAALGLEDVPVKQSLLREGLEDIVENVMSGNDFRERIEAATDLLQRMEKSLAQVRERYGKPFEFSEELKKAHERYDEYADKMKKELEEKEKKYAEMDEDVAEAAGVVDAEEAEEEEENGTLYREVSDEEAVREAGFDMDGMYAGKPQTARGRRWTRRQIEEANRRATERFYRVVEKMGISDRVHVYESGDAYLSAMGVEHPTKEQRREAESKGWFNPRTRQIYVIAGNNRSLSDAVKTLLHEGVAHYGLRELVGEERFDQFLDEVYGNAEQEIRERIDAKVERLKERDAAGKTSGRRQKGDAHYRRVATEEFMADTAQEMDFENDSPDSATTVIGRWWQNVKALFMKMLGKLGLGSYDGPEIGLNEIRYILWRSWKNMTEPGRYRNPWDAGARAEVRVMEERLGVDETSRGSREVQVGADGRGKAAESRLDFDEKKGMEDLTERMKGRYPDAMFLIRSGGRYYVTGLDGVTASQVLDGRVGGGEFADGVFTFPARGMDVALPLLIRNGKRVAVVDAAERRVADSVAEPESRVWDELSSRGSREAQVRVYDDETDWANDRFNGELDAFKEKRHRGLLHLGRPMGILRACGVDVKELTLSPTILHYKLKEHGLTTEDLKGLAKAVQSPILVYKHGLNHPNLAVVTNLNVKNGKLSVALILDKEGNVVEISNISSVHSKEAVRELDRLSIFSEDELKDALRWVDKKEVSDWLLRLPYEDERTKDNPKLESVAKVINNFENPKVLEENFGESGNLYRDDDGELDKYDPVRRAEQLVNRDTMRKIVDFFEGTTDKVVKLWNDGQYKLAGRLFKDVYGVDNVVVTDNTTVDDLVNKGFSKSLAKQIVDEQKKGDESKFAAQYHPISDKIVIFAHRKKSLAEIRSELMHESIHQYLRKLPNREAILHEFWETYSGMQKDLVDAITDKDEGYAKEDWEEEFFTYMLEFALSRNKRLAFKEAGDSIHNVIDGYLNTINYGDSSVLKEIFGGFSLAGRRGFIREEREARERIRRGRENQGGQPMEVRNAPSKESGRSTEELIRNESPYFYARKEGVGDDLSLDLDDNPAYTPANAAYEQAVMDTGNMSFIEAVKDRTIFRRIKNKFAEAYFDYSRALKQLQNAVEKSIGRKLFGFENAWQALNAKSSVDNIEIQQAMLHLIAPLSEHIGSNILGKELDGNPITMDDVEAYLNAVHGIERNQKMAGRQAAEKGNSVEENRKDYAGLTELFTKDGEETLSLDELENRAKEYAKRFEDAVGKKSVDELWKLVKTLNDFSLQKSYDTGLISKEQLEEYQKMYEHYVPLRGWHNDYAGDIYQYVSRGEPAHILQNVIKKAYGRKSRAGNILGTMASMANSAIVQGNRNLVNQKLYHLAMGDGFKSGLLMVGDSWYEKNASGEWVPVPVEGLRDDMTADEMRAAIEAHNKKMEELEKLGKAKIFRKKFSKEFPLHLAKWQEQKHAVRVLVGGKEHLVYVLGNPRAAMALNGLLNKDNSSDIGWVADKIMQLMRFQAKMQTSLSPVFWVGNFQRDILTAIGGEYTKFGWKSAGKFVKNLMKVIPVNRMFVKGEDSLYGGGIFTLFKRYNHGELDMSDDMQRYFEEFCNGGGITGISLITSEKDYEKQMEKTAKRMTQGKAGIPRKAKEAVIAGIVFVNSCIENATRFAAYMTSRQSGKSILDSIFDAKEASVNFNMKGSGAWGNLWVRRYILYANPALQALRMLGTWHGESPKRFMAGMATILATSLITAFINSLLSAGGDDGGDDDNEWWKLSEWNRYNYINIKLPWMNGYLHYSLPQEYRPLWAMGQISFDWYHGKITKERALHSMLVQMNNLSPMAFFEGGLDTGSSVLKTLVKAFTPTVLSNFTDAYIWNENFLGQK